jgi:hypothetical protein
MTRTGKLREDAMAVSEELLHGLGVLAMLLAAALAAQRSRVRLRRQGRRHRLCRSHG